MTRCCNSVHVNQGEVLPEEQMSDSCKRFASVYVDVPISPEGPAFHYAVPPELTERIQIGSFVKVPFGSRVVDGWVAGFISEPEVPVVKPITRLVGTEPVIDAVRLRLARLVSNRFQSPLSETIRAMIPAYVKVSSPGRRKKTAVGQKTRKNVSDISPDNKRGFELCLTPDQEKAIRALERAQTERHYRGFVLFGVTGSGKTEVYLRAISRSLSLGRQAIMLVPEIALTPQAIRQLKSHFGSDVAVLHSGVSRREGYEAWRRVCLGEAKVVLGARSAVFAPCLDPGVIILDEEHEFTYKECEDPRYHAREVAEMRAKLAGGVVVFGSATPSVETFYNALHGKYEMLYMPSRVDGLHTPSVSVVDMRRVFSGGSRKVLSPALQTKMKDAISRGEKIILFVNRRGYSPFVLCRECGYTERCPNCDVSLTFHLKQKVMICHYCGYKKRPPQQCPSCGGTDIKLFGLGTQRVEETVKNMFEDAEVVRLDSDTTTKKGSHKAILDAFRNGPANVLVGTQMVAKGLDIPEVTLVGVISADTTLHLPDFRASERTFQMVTQVAGRTGRGHLGGEVIIQTFNPDHYSIEMASLQDYRSFYDKEILYRKELRYPPFSHIANIWVSSEDEEQAKQAAAEVAHALDATRTTPTGESVTSSSPESESHGGCRVMGPVPAPIYELRRRFRWLIMLEAPDWTILCKRIRSGIGQVSRNVGGASGVRISIDVDPVDML
jgi:primosomal protein N' (replication factor Y)